METWSVILVGGVPLQGRFSLGDWQLARALARRRPVLYVDPPLYPRTLLTQRDPRLLLGRRRTIGPNLEVVRPLSPPGANRPWGVRLGDRVIGSQIHRVQTRPDQPRVLLTFDPKRGVLPRVERDLLVYWRRDRLTHSANTAHPELVRQRDIELIQTADLVTGVSPPLVEEAEALGATSVLIPNGCDYAHFATPVPRPPGFPTTRPVIGFAGGVSWRIDIELLLGLADARPDWTLLLVGEEATAMPERRNIVRVGPQPYSELPGWLQGFDVGVVPYRLDGFNLAAAPLKVYEYLAAGVPVVSTALPAVRPLANLISTADTTASFIAAIEETLHDRADGEACRAVARENDWDARAALLDTHIEASLRSTRTT